MIVQRLKPWVDSELNLSFSEAIKYQYQHGDEIWVGGEITDIFSVPNVVDLIPELGGEKDPMFDAVYMTLDDGVGLNRLVIPREAYLKYKEMFDISVGSIILAQGRVFQLEMREQIKEKKIDREIKNHPEGSIRILCWKVVPLPEPKVE